MWNKFKKTEFYRKLKQVSTNRTVYITAITLLVALAVLITVTAIANRNKKPPVTPDSGIRQGSDPTPGGKTDGQSQTGENDTGSKSGTDDKTPGTSGGSSGTGTDSKTTGTLPTSFTLPANGSLAKGHDATVQVWSNTMGDWRVHLGVDITTVEAAQVFAAADGSVEKIWEDPMMGRCLAISHSGDCRTIYKNLAPDLAEGITEGATVTAGQVLGTVGDSAIMELAEEPHLHFEMTVNGLQVDPLEYFDAAAIATLAGDDSYEDLPTGAGTGMGQRGTATGTDVGGNTSGGNSGTTSKPIPAK